MKLASPLLLLGLALGVSASLQAIEQVLNGIETQTTNLGNAIEAFSGGSISAVQTQSDTLVTTIHNGVTTVDAQPVLDVTDAVTLSQFVTGLISAVQKTVSDAIGKKSLLVQNCFAPVTLEELEAQFTAASDLSTAILSKVPNKDGLPAVASVLAASITNAIQSGINAFTGIPVAASCSTTTTTTRTTTTTSATTTPRATTTTTAASTTTATTTPATSATTATTTTSSPAAPTTPATSATTATTTTTSPAAPTTPATSPTTTSTGTSGTGTTPGMNSATGTVNTISTSPAPNNSTVVSPAMTTPVMVVMSTMVSPSMTPGVTSPVVIAAAAVNALGIAALALPLLAALAV